MTVWPRTALQGILAVLALQQCLSIRPEMGDRENKVIGWSEKYRDADGSPSLHIEHLSWSPRAFLYGNFLTEDECDHLIKISKPHMKDATILDKKTGKQMPNSLRQNKETHLEIGQDEIVNKIEFRISRYTFLPGYNGEPMHMMYTTPGHGYEPHTDWLEDWWHPQLGNERIATVIMYLNDVAEGGETLFPNSTSQPHKMNATYRTCGKKGLYEAEKGGQFPWTTLMKGLSVKPKKGDALMFYNLLENGRTDGQSLHQGCPVIKGDKWTATKRILVNRRPLDNTVAAFRKAITSNMMATGIKSLPVEKVPELDASTGEAVKPKLHWLTPQN